MGAEIVNRNNYIVGNKMEKVLPAPSLLWQEILPPWRSIMAAAMDNPRPLPLADSGVLAEDTV